MNHGLPACPWFIAATVAFLGPSGCKEVTLNLLDKESIEALAPIKPKYKLDNHGKVRELSLEDQSIDDTVLERIQMLDQLRVLNLCRTNVTDNDLAKLTVLKRLQTLRVRETLITDKGLIHLEHLEDLHSLALTKCEAITSEGVEALRRALPGLKVYR